MNNVKIRAYKDGNNFVVYFENVSPDMESFLKNMFNPLMESDSKLEQPQIEVEDPVLPAGCGKYSGKKVSEVLSEDGNRGYANLCYFKDVANVFNTKDALAINDLLGEYLFNTFSGVDPKEYAAGLSVEDADEWLKCFNNLVTEDTKKKVCNLTGFQDYKAFLKDASQEQKVSLIYNVIMSMGFHR